MDYDQLWSHLPQLSHTRKYTLAIQNQLRCLHIVQRSNVCLLLLFLFSYVSAVAYATCCCLLFIISKIEINHTAQSQPICPFFSSPSTIPFRLGLWYVCPCLWILAFFAFCLSAAGTEPTKIMFMLTHRRYILLFGCLPFCR